MSLATKPSQTTNWGETSSNITEPALGFKQAGWATNAQVPAAFLNWLLNRVETWLAWLRDFEANDHTWTGIQTFPSTASIARPSVSTLTANSGWDFTGAYAGIDTYCRYWKDGVGVVHFEAGGVVTSGSPSANPFTSALPSGFRPGGAVPISVGRTPSGFGVGGTNDAVIPGNIDRFGAVSVHGTSNGDNVRFSGSWYGT